MLTLQHFVCVFDTTAFLTSRFRSLIFDPRFFRWSVFLGGSFFFDFRIASFPHVGASGFARGEVAVVRDNRLAGALSSLFVFNSPFFRFERITTQYTRGYTSTWSKKRGSLRNKLFQEMQIARSHALSFTVVRVTSVQFDRSDENRCYQRGMAVA